MERWRVQGSRQDLAEALPHPQQTKEERMMRAAAVRMTICPPCPLASKPSSKNSRKTARRD